MRRSALLVLVVLAALLAIGGIARLRSPRDSEPEGKPATASDDSPMMSLERARDAEAAVRRVIPSEPASSGPLASADSTDRLLSLRRAFEYLHSANLSIPPFRGTTFSDVDLSPLRRLVRENAVEASDPVALLESVSATEPVRPLMLAAFAYAGDVTESDREFLLGAMRDDSRAAAAGGEASVEWSRFTSAFASVFSLSILGAAEQLETAASEVLAMPRERDTYLGQVLRDLTLLTVSGLPRDAPESVLGPLRDIAAAPPEMALTSGAWQALARSGSAGDRMAVLQEAELVNGHAREGIERMRDPLLAPTLERMILGEWKGVYGSYLASSSARGPLSIDTEESLAAFERLFASPESRACEAARAALAPMLDPPPSAAATLLRISAQPGFAAGEGGTAFEVEEAVRLIRERLGRATVSRRDVERTLQGLREALPDLAASPLALRRGLEVLALGGDETDRLTLERYLLDLTEADREAVRGAWNGIGAMQPLR